MSTKKAFTLIELLVVIAIIALLLSILVPGLKASKEKAQSLVCQSNLKQWNMLVGYFLADNKYMFPDSDWNNDGSNDAHGQWWIQPFKQYMNADNMKILICGKAKLHPNDIPGEIIFQPTKHNECWGSRDQAPAPTANKWTWASYAPNAWMMDPGYSTWGAPVNGRPKEKLFWGKLDRVTTPYQVPLFLDSRWVDVWPDDTDQPNDPEWGGANGSGYTTTGYGYMTQVALTRHGKLTNIVFMDGSSRRTDIKDLWGLKWYREFKTSNPYTRGERQFPPWMK